MIVRRGRGWKVLVLVKEESDGGLEGRREEGREGWRGWMCERGALVHKVISSMPIGII